MAAVKLNDLVNCDLLQSSVVPVPAIMPWMALQLLNLAHLLANFHSHSSCGSTDYPVDHPREHSSGTEPIRVWLQWCKTMRDQLEAWKPPTWPQCKKNSEWFRGLHMHCAGQLFGH